MQYSPQTSSGQSPEGTVNPLSCVSCRQRKVKCNRIHPCSQCVRGGLECVFPSRKRNRKPRHNRQNELLARLSKLEEIVGRVDPASLSSLSAADEAVTSATPEPPTPVPIPLNSQEDDDKPQQPASHLPPPKDNPSTRYIGAEFWSHLCGEVHGLKQALEQPSDSDDEEEDPTSESSPEAQNIYHEYCSETSPAILGSEASTKSEAMRHPKPGQIREMCNIYFSNVDFIVKILHRPTILTQFDAFLNAGAGHTIGRETECLFFAIYFAAVTSITPEVCRTRLGEERNVLVARYKQATEAALSRADYLNNNDIVPLQAFMLYVACLRNHDGSRASWALLALALRLSQALGLQRDGDGSAFTPYEAEMRRRLFWLMVVLDVRAVQDRGTEAMITNDMYNTHLPTHVSDDDFGPDSTEIVAREGGTDVTFFLASAICSDIFFVIVNPQSKFRKPMYATPAAPTEELILRKVRKLEDRFVNGADLSHYPSAMAARIVRLITLIFWLEVQYPFQVRQGLAARPRVSREHMLQTAVSIMELHAMGETMPYAERFNWWADTWVQWHPLAVALAELCTQTRGPLVERAWRVIDDYLPRFTDKIADSKRGTLWRPIRKLLKKARTARAEALMSNLSLGEGNGNQTQQQPQQQPAAAVGAAIMTDAAQATREQTPALDPNFFDNIPMSPSSYLAAQDPTGSSFNFEFDPTMDAAQDPDLMDWSNWNEFVTDAYGDLEAGGGVPDGPENPTRLEMMSRYPDS